MVYIQDHTPRVVAKGTGMGVTAGTFGVIGAVYMVACSLYSIWPLFETHTHRTIHSLVFIVSDKMFSTLTLSYLASF